MAETWHLKGEYLENCNCAILCPCLVGPRNERGAAMAEPTEGHCDVPLAFRIDEGAYGDVSLDGTSVVLAAYTPGRMGDGGWTAALYVDETASAEQRAALESIFTGRAGGRPAGLALVVAEWHPTRAVAIEFGVEGRRRWARIPDVLDVEIEGLPGAAESPAEIWIDNVRHLVATRLAAAKALRGIYRDHNFDWDNTGRNGHYASFAWQGP